MQASSIAGEKERCASFDGPDEGSSEMYGHFVDVEEYYEVESIGSPTDLPDDSPHSRQFSTSCTSSWSFLSSDDVSIDYAPPSENMFKEEFPCGELFLNNEELFPSCSRRPREDKKKMIPGLFDLELDS